MKKTLIALTVAVSAVSGVAHAWTSGNFNDSFDINGTIAVDAYSYKWEWMIGESLSFHNTTRDLTGENNVLSITQSRPVPILLGRTKEAFSAPSIGVGAIPLISFSDYEGNDVLLQDSSEDNKGYFVLPMKDPDGQKLGQVKVNVMSAGLVIDGVSSVSGETSMAMYSGVKSSDRMGIYYGGLVSSPKGTGSVMSEIVSKFGNYDHNALLTQLIAAEPNVDVNQIAPTNAPQSVNMVDYGAKASSYALGIDQGQTIEATFTNPVTRTTQWSAPLNVAVTYN
ncbi:fimbrial protein [Escherichia coli]|uniref:F4 family fimbrial subunit n=1 Tax=Escherichia coli TaxID=562 RepID=UPI001F5B2F19|nr:fimbrial protein [Escherichia coli]MCI3086827.1 fimbrial protein [Escherichia coli]